MRSARKKLSVAQFVVVLCVVGTLSNCSDTGPESVDAPTGTDVTSPTIEEPVSGPSSTVVLERGPLVRFSEVHYHAVDNDPGKEFVELSNQGDQSAQLQDWCIKGMGYCFSKPLLIEPGGYVVVRQSEAEGNLSNSGEKLELVDALGQSLEVLEYNDTGDWPTAADGGGLSLQRSNFEISAELPAAWTGATPTPGTPFAPEQPSPANDVVITEVHYHPQSGNPAEAFIEVTNISDSEVDLSGWCLGGTKFCWKQPTPVKPGAAVSAKGVLAAGGLSHRRDRIRVIDRSGRVHDTVVYEDRGEWPALADGEGYSLHRRASGAAGDNPGNWELAGPTPDQGPTSLSKPLIPIFRDVEFTIGPAAGAPIKVSAKVKDATSVDVEYVVGFGEPNRVAARLTDGKVAATIPGQTAGSLVRFRLVAAGKAQGTWPREGDGSRYGGTVVKEDGKRSKVATLQWFIDPATWKLARGNTRLQGNDGYAAVIAFDGVVVDNVTLRIKGNQARTSAKKKWKVMLPAGHSFDAGGLIKDSVDQFDLLSLNTDKSYSREVLVSDLQELSGGLSQQVFPLRLDVNGKFFGLYMYGESPEGNWRDRSGFSDSAYVWKAEGLSKLRRLDSDLPQGEFRKHYERLTLGYLDDNDDLLRTLIKNLDKLEGQNLVSWAYANLDIPEIVEAIATMRIVQHAEWQHKNYLVIFDPTDARWRLVPIDFDLTFGRMWQSPCNARCDNVAARNMLEYPGQNKLARVILKNEPFRSMVDRRTRELAEVYLGEGRLEKRLAGLNDLVGDLAALDQRKWGSFGTQQTMQQAQRRIISAFLEPLRVQFLGERSPLPKPQPSKPKLRTQTLKSADGVVQQATITNEETFAVDVSNRKFPEIGAVLPAGTVIPAGTTLFIEFERAPAPKSGWWVRAQRLRDD